MSAVAEIEDRLSEVKSELARLYKKAEVLEEEAEGLEGALYTVIQYIGDGVPAKKKKNEIEIEGLTAQQNIVVQALPIGKKNKKKPTEIAKNCRKLDPSYVRTTLWRLAQYEIIASESGYYWYNS